MSITLENGRINLDSLVTIEDPCADSRWRTGRWTVLKTKCLSVPIKNQTGTDGLQLRTNHGSGLAHESANNWLFCAVRKRTLTVFAGSMKMKP